MPKGLKAGLIFFISLALVIITRLALAQEPPVSGMITIEVVENPSFFELYANYIYLGIILAVLTIFIWRRSRQRRA